MFRRHNHRKTDAEILRQKRFERFLGPQATTGRNSRHEVGSLPASGVYDAVPYCNYGPSPFMNTRPEVMIQDWLRQVHIRFETQFEIKATLDYGLRHRYDIALPDHRIVIEADGCYWHGHGCQTRLAPGIKRRRERDRFINRVTGLVGWKMIRRWQCQILANPGCIANDKNSFDSTAWSKS